MARSAGTLFLIMGAPGAGTRTVVWSRLHTYACVFIRTQMTVLGLLTVSWSYHVCSEHWACCAFLNSLCFCAVLPFSLSTLSCIDCSWSAWKRLWKMLPHINFLVKYPRKEETTRMRRCEVVRSNIFIWIISISLGSTWYHSFGRWSARKNSSVARWIGSNKCLKSRQILPNTPFSFHLIMPFSHLTFVSCHLRIRISHLTFDRFLGSCKHIGVGTMGWSTGIVHVSGDKNQYSVCSCYLDPIVWCMMSLSSVYFKWAIDIT